MLHLLGYEADRAPDGRAAVMAVERGGYDIILMDLQMPVMDGLEATIAIRATAKSLPIVAITGNVVEEERRRCLASGMDDILPKPYRFHELREMLAKWLPDHAREGVARSSVPGT